MKTDDIDADTRDPTLSNSPSFNLPSEIIELIGTHFIYADSGMCPGICLSLVNRDLLKLSRRTYFSLLEFIDDNKGPRKLDRFLDLLESPHSTLGPFVKCIMFEKFMFKSNQHFPKARPNARSLGSQLVNVQSVRIMKMRWGYETPDLLAFLAAIPTQELHITSSDSFRVDQWQMLYNMWRGCRIFLLGTLIGQNEDIWEKDIPPSDVFKQPVQITLLDINALYCMQQVWDPNIFRGVGDLVSIESLLVAKMHRYKYARMPFVRRFLKHIAQSLKQLVIQCESISRRQTDMTIADPLENLFDPSTAWSIPEILIGPLHTLAPQSEDSIFAPDYLQRNIQRICLHVPTTETKVLTLICSCSVWLVDRDLPKWIKGIDEYPWKQVFAGIAEAIPSLTRLRIIFRNCTSQRFIEAVERAKGQMLEGINSQTRLEISILPRKPGFPVKRWWEGQIPPNIS